MAYNVVNKFMRFGKLICVTIDVVLAADIPHVRH